MQSPKQYVDYLFYVNFEAVRRLFVLSYQTLDSKQTMFFFNHKNYNVMIDGKKIFDDKDDDELLFLYSRPRKDI